MLNKFRLTILGRISSSSHVQTPKIFCTHSLFEDVNLSEGEKSKFLSLCLRKHLLQKSYNYAVCVQFLCVQKTIKSCKNNFSKIVLKYLPTRKHSNNVANAVRINANWAFQVQLCVTRFNRSCWYASQRLFGCIK